MVAARAASTGRPRRWPRHGRPRDGERCDGRCTADACADTAGAGRKSAVVVEILPAEGGRRAASTDADVGIRCQTSPALCTCHPTACAPSVACTLAGLIATESLQVGCILLQILTPSAWSALHAGWRHTDPQLNPRHAGALASTQSRRMHPQRRAPGSPVATLPSTAQ